MVGLDHTIIILGTILFLFSSFVGVFAANVGFLFYSAVFLTLSIVSLYNTLFFIETRNRP